MSKILLSLASASLLSAALSAQVLTVTDSNMLVTLGGLSPSLQSPRLLNLQADALLTDHGFEHGWYYRMAGDPQEYAVRSLGGVTGGNFGNTHSDRDVNDVDSRGLLRMSYDFDVYSCGPASGVFISRCTVMNISNAPVAFDLFAYTDIDVAGTPGDDFLFYGTNNSHWLTDPTGISVEVRASGASLGGIANYPLIRSALMDAAPTTLLGTPPSFGGDYTGAFQWAVPLQPREQRTFHVAFLINTPGIALPLVQNYGAGSGTDLQVHTQFLPLQDASQTRSFAVQLKGALPNVEYRIGFAQFGWSPLPFIPGIDLWIDPFNLLGIYGGFTSNSGDAFNVFFIPPSPYLTGFSLYSQVFGVNPNAPNGFADFSAGMQARIGLL